MKKCVNNRAYQFVPVKKALLIMRLILFLVLTGFVQGLASEAYAQRTKLSLSHRNSSLESILDDIENQTEFYFLYNEKLVDVKRTVSIQAQDVNVNEILSLLFAETDVVYNIVDRKIVLAPREMNASLQQATLSGLVTDRSGSPLPGVTVVVKGTTIGTITDVDGRYILATVPNGSVIVFSFVGMRSQEIAYQGQTTLSVEMQDQTIGLDEVVAIGYGTQRRENVIGSVTAVRAEELTAAPVSRVSNALAGRLPGGIFMQESGEPGNDAATIRVRGSSTFGENQPLVVIDGIPGRDLNSLNPEDIESITVLKDASAAIYGSRAANGVILVTTKGGATDTPAKLTYSFYEGLLSPSKLPELADAATYATMIREMQSYRNVPEANMRYSLADVEKYRSGEFPWTHPNTDWYAEALKPYSSTRSHNLALSGGTSRTTYHTSFGTQFDNGIYVNSATSYNRYNLKVSINSKVNDYLTLGLNMSAVQENRMYPTKSTGSIFNTLIRMYPTSHAIFPGTDLPGPDIEYGDQPMVSASFQTGFDDDKRYRADNIFSASLKIPGIEGLVLSGYFAYDIYMQRRKLFQKPWTLYTLDQSAYLAAGNTGREDGAAFLRAKTIGYAEPRVTNYSAYSESKTINAKLDYETTLNNAHNISAFVAYEQNEFNNGGFEAFRRFFISDQLPYLFAGGDAEKNNNEFVGLDARVNYFGRFGYDYKGIYLFQFNFRRDGSLRFSKETGRWGNFPSVLFGYRPSEQDWWQNSLSFISDFKLRGSFGQMGNDQVAAFQYLTSYGFNTGYSYGENRSYSAGLDQSNVPNPFITWEVANVYNAGFEAITLNRKLSIETDFFYERRSDILIKRDVSVPRFTGISLPDENFGVVTNRGFEAVVAYRDQSGEFKYSVSVNAAFARNRIVEADEPQAPVPWQTRTGKPMNALLLYRHLGVYRDMDHVKSTAHLPQARPGDLIIEDYDGDGKITTNDRQLFPLTTTPELTFGLSFDAAYKNWQLRALVQGHGRALRYIYSDERIGTAGNYFKWDADDRWTPDNPNGTKPRAYERIEEYWRGSHRTDYHYADVSYARLKNLQLSYLIPKTLVDKIGIADAKVFIAGQNLFLIYSGNKIMDPETGSMGAYPIMKVMSIGAQITF